MDDDRDSSGPSWLWGAIAIALVGLLLIWIFNTWVVESNVKPGASPEGLAFPAKPGVEVQAPTEGMAAQAPAPAVDVTVPGETPAAAQ